MFPQCFPLLHSTACYFTSKRLKMTFSQTFPVRNAVKIHRGLAKHTMPVTSGYRASAVKKERQDSFHPSLAPTFDTATRGLNLSLGDAYEKIFLARDVRARFLHGFSPPLPSPLAVNHPPCPTVEPAVAEETRPVREVVRPRLAPPALPLPSSPRTPPFPLPSPAPWLKDRTTSPVRTDEPRAFESPRVIMRYSPEFRVECPRRMCQNAFETQTTTSLKNAARKQWLQS